MINGNPIYTRTAVNRLREKGAYVCDCGSEIKHNPKKEGAIALAHTMLDTIIEVKNPEDGSHKA